MRTLPRCLCCACALVALAGCAGASPAPLVSEPEPLAQPEPEPAPAPPAAPVAMDASVSLRAPGPLTRAEVDALVARGLGALLARVTVSPVLEGGRFRGFRIDDAVDLASWQAAGADLRRGDVLVRVNGVRIERPEHAMSAFAQLRVLSVITVELLRDGQRVTVSSPIVNTPAAPEPRG